LYGGEYIHRNPVHEDTSWESLSERYRQNTHKSHGLLHSCDLSSYLFSVELKKIRGRKGKKCEILFSLHAVSFIVNSIAASINTPDTTGRAVIDPLKTK
jgi:hypothetical protein